MGKYLFAARGALVLLFLVTSGLPVLSQNTEKPDDDRFTKVILAQRVEEPMQFQVMNDGKVIYAERKGKLKLYDPKTGSITIIANLAVSTKYTSKTGEVTEGEDGFQGVMLDPDYEINHWIYVYYSPAGNESKNTLERYTWLGKGLILNSKKTLLDVPVQREECCHVGGGMVFDKNKNLYLSTGDNTFSRASDGFTPLDERPGFSAHDSQRSAGNTNDLRGKVLRIHPEANGTYTIPAGNLFPKGTVKTRPEIFTMGNRNPWRLTIDSKTGWLYWGEVGPDGSRDDFEKRGPQSYDEFNQAKKAGNYGWPYFVANNKAYREYDFATHQSGDFFDPLAPKNTSANNTGMVDLPPAVPAFMWYSKAPSVQFPPLGSGGNSAVGGPIFHRQDFKNPLRPFPPYYEGKWFITDWVRGWINVVEISGDGAFKSIERFLPDLKLRGPIDMKFGPDGDLYALEYGNRYFKDNPEAELIRIEYNGGNRRPQVMASANKVAGALPLAVNFSSAGTKDFDKGDVLTYQWKITKNGVPFKSIKQPDPAITFTTAGIYKATLTVTDNKGAKNSQTIQIVAGNDPPVVKFNITSGNSSFFFPGKSITYAVAVEDKEDGSLANKRIEPGHVSVTGNYLSEGYNLTDIAQRQMAVDASARYSLGVALIAKMDCRSCHAVKEKILGPAFEQVALKYKGNNAAPNMLARKIITGGSGSWGDAMMPAHPTMVDADVKAIVKYILSLSNPPPRAKSLPVEGTYTTKIPNGENTDGTFIFRAAYTDKGAKKLPPQSSEDIWVLHSPTIPVSKAVQFKNIRFNKDSTVAQVKNSGATLQFNHIDLTGIKQIKLNLDQTEQKKPPALSSTIEVYSGATHGKLIAKYSGNVPAESSININIIESTGISDLYFVFSDASINITSIKFNN